MKIFRDCVTNTQSLTSFSPLSETEVSKLILSNHPTTCPLDPIPTHLLQAISSSVIPALTHIINTSLHTGTFPTAFKQARVCPLLKKPALNPAHLENYRPVSLLPFIAKTLEWVVFNQLSLFLAQNNILDNNQSGFRSGHSTETALLSVTEALRLARAASAPIYLNSLVQTYAPSRSLRSASEQRLVVPSQRGTKSLSRTFSWTVPSWWNALPISIRTVFSHFQKTSKDTSFSPAPD